MGDMGTEIADGLTLYKSHFKPGAQHALVSAVREVVKAAPLFTPTMPRTGKPMRVRMTNCGDLGWVTDQVNGYRYQETHPVTGDRWPEIPAILTSLWKSLSGIGFPAEACLVNYYNQEARMGLHQDRDESFFDAPVVSISLGDDCLFRYGGTSRGGKTQSIRLASGDVLIMAGPSRLCFHGVDRIYPGTSALLEKGGRLNLTLRRVTVPQD